MGLGDEIMVAGECREIYHYTSKRVKVRHKNGGARWDELWNGNPIIAHPHEIGDFAWCETRSGHRPYVDRTAMAMQFADKYGLDKPFTLKDRSLPWIYTDWKTPIGELFIEREPAGNYIVVEPHIKLSGSPNKLWGFGRTAALVQRHSADWVQMIHGGAKRLDGARHVETATFLDACGVLSGAKCYVGPEGGLHHAAAALNIPAVVIFGGMTSPANTGYDSHVNLFQPDGSPCGRRVPCEHCTMAMEAITVEMVADMIPIAIEKGRQ